MSLDSEPSGNEMGNNTAPVATFNDITERKQTEKSTRLSRLYGVLSKINEAIVRIREPQKLFEKVCRVAVEDGQFEMAWIGLADHDTKRIKAVAKYGDDEGYLDSIHISLDKDTPEGQGPTGIALREGRVHVNNDTENNPAMKPWRNEQLIRGYKASASFPLLIENQTIGAMTLYAKKVNYFDDEEIQLLKSLADDVSFAIESADIERQRLQATEELRRARDELEARVRERTANLELMYNITKISTSSLDIVKVSEQVLESLVKSFDLTQSVVYLWDDQHKELVPTASYGYPCEPSNPISPQSLDSDDMVVGAFKSGEPIFIANRYNVTTPKFAQESMEKAELLIGRQLSSSIALPLTTYRRTIGVIAFSWSEARMFSPEDVEFFISIAHEIAVGLENARLHTQTERELARTQLLQDVAIAATTRPDLQTISNGILQALKKYINLKSGVFYRFNQKELVFKVLSTLNFDETPIAKIKEFSITSEEFFSPKVVQANKILTHNDDTLSPERVAILKKLGAWGNRYVGIPIKYRAKTIGVIFLVFKGRRDFTQGELALFNSIAHIACQAMENTRLYEAEKKRAEELAEHRKNLEKTIRERTQEISDINIRLRHSEAQHRQIIEASPDAYFIFGNNKIIYANPAALHLFGFNKTREIDITILKNLIRSDKFKELESLKGSQNPVHLGEITIVRESGLSITVEGIVIPIIFEKEAAYQYIIRDITQRKEIEKEMARLDRLNLIGEMAAGIGHEIRNPMTAVRGFLQILGTKEECVKYKDYFDLMIEELDRANSIITEFLKLARNKTVEKKLFNLNDEIKTLFPLIQSDAMKSDKNIVLELEEIPDLLMDEKEIRQVILNLVRNGLEASPAGSDLMIKTFTVDNDVILAIKDNGKGINPDVLEKIGTPFFTTKDNGTGLGLAVCYSIAERHNAKIEIETGRNGTTFYIRLKQFEQAMPAVELKPFAF